MKMYQVGGCVRDEILGIPSKDIDFSVVLSPDEVPNPSLTAAYITPFEIMCNNLFTMGFKIFLESPEFLTVRAQFPKKEQKMNASDELNRFQFANPGLTADFVLARKESGYTDGRRPDRVEIGTLLDDQKRRDFGMNSIAKAADGTLIDPFNGVADINDRVIRAVGNAFERLTEDALRAVRAMRFSVTKGFRIDKELEFAMETTAVVDALRDNISDERIREELSKMFRFDTLSSLNVLRQFPTLTDAMLSGTVSLDSTTKTKGRGK